MGWKCQGGVLLSLDFTLKNAAPYTLHFTRVYE